MKRVLALLLALVMPIGMLPLNTLATETPEVFEITETTEEETAVSETEVAHTHEYAANITFPNRTEQGYTFYTCSECGDSYRTPWLDKTAYDGKTIACVGDSITAAYGVTKDETDYVTLLAQLLGMEYIRLGDSGTTLCTDGSRICNIRRLTEDYLQSADIVTIALGINDFCNAAEGYYELGDIECTDSSTIYGATRMWCERIVELRKTDSLNHTQFYFVTPIITSWNNSVTTTRDWDQSKTNIHGYTLRDLCNAIIEVAALYDIAVIDMNLLSGMYYVDAADNNTAVFGGDGVHPGTQGHEMMANALANALLQNDLRNDHTHTFGSWISTTWPTCVAGEQKRVCSVCSATESRSIASGGNHRYEAVVTSPTHTEQGYTTYTCFICGDSYVDNFTDPIMLTSYRWEMQNNILASVTTGNNTANTLTQTSGSITDGTLMDARYTLQDSIRLYHDEPWVIEWRSSGNWDGMLLGSEMDSSLPGLTYLFRYAPMNFLAFGEFTDKWNNYGIIHEIDMTVAHVFRLENRVAEDGTNTVFLLVDGQEIDAMHHYYIGGSDQNNTFNWVDGRDLVFSNLGTSSHPINAMQLDYLQIWEAGHTHTYHNGFCTVCDTEHPNLAKLDGKVISVLGDSISTFAGYIPVADGFNLEHLARYPQDNLLTDVNETWWMQVISTLNAKLGINDSWRGATVSGAVPVTTGSTGENAAMGNLQRIKNLGANGTPDVILFYGGTNDFAHVSKVGTFDAANAPSTVDLTTAKWDNLADGYVHTLLRLQYFYPEAQIIAMLPTYTNGYYSDEKLAEGNAVLAAICEHYGVTYVDLRECGISTADLPDNIHPDATGMDYITAAVIDTLLNACEMEAGENIVHSVTHKLTNAESSMGYYKGISHGKSFVATITGEDVTVSVIMGGVDITSECYANGIVSIFEVTDDIIISAEGTAKPIYEDHLQQLPGNTCSSTNLWAKLTHDQQYYTVNGWGIHSSGTVYSVTFPVSAGDHIYATSFGAAGTNGSSINGIRVTWFDENGVLNSVSADNVYAEFSANGYLSVPEGAVVVSIPMWTVSDDNEIYIINRDHHYENGVCLGCGDEQRPVVGWSLTLGEDIGMNFLLGIDKNLADQIAVQITVADGDTVTYKVSDHTPDEDGNYLFRVNVAAAQMTDDVKLQIFVGEEAGEVYTYTVEQYAKAILSNENFSSYHALVKEMLSYGAAAQTYFNYNPDKPIDSALFAGAGTKEIEETLPEITNNGNIEGITFYGATLLHQSKTALRFYFKGADMRQCTVTANEKVLQPIERNGLWYVEIRDILPQSLSEPVTVNVACGDNGITVSYSPMHYISRMSQKGSDTLQVLLKAMYNYHLAAKAMAESA